MRSLPVLIVLTLAAFALPARGQDTLPDEPKKEEPKKEEPKKEEPKKESAASSPGETVEVRDDRIKSVQRKMFLKSGRFEVTPLFAVSLNDAFYQKMGGGAAAAWHPADSLGLELQFVYTATIQTDMTGFFQQANSALPNASQMRFFLMANVMWSPIYGKLAFFTDDIMMFDAYLLGGFGLAQTETGSKFASDIGLGLRYFLTSWLVVKLEVRDLIYTETLRLDVQQTQYSDIQNHLLLMAGVSFFFPVDFEYEFQ